MTNDFQSSYIDVERAYSQGQFEQALTKAKALLNERSDDTDALQYSRLQLLTGHIHLYGLKQREEAAPYYRQVLEGSSETTYRDLARQGLELCERAPEADPEPSPALPAEPPFLTSAAGVVASGAAAGSPAMPWLKTTSPADELPQTEAEEAELIEPVMPLGMFAPEDPGIIEAKVVTEITPRDMSIPQTTPSAFSSEELVQLAKGRLRVVLS